MAVGPSQAPIIAIEHDSGRLNPSARARRRVKKMPNCPAAPKMSTVGLASIGPKSIIAPSPMKIRQGNISVRMPAL